MLAVLKHTIVTRDQKIFLKLYKQLVRPHLEYAAIIWNPHFKRDINLIERVQKWATRCIIGMSGKSYEKRLGILKLESLAKRRCVFDLVEVYKICHDSSSLFVDKFFQHESCNCTTGHDLKFFRKPFCLDCKKYFFTELLVNGTGTSGEKSTQKL